MSNKFSLEWLTNKFDQGESLKFLYFWGHQKRPGDPPGKFCFSQWFELPFMVDGVTYQTAEHWMMANKALLFDDLKTYEKILNTKSPGAAKKLGRQVLGFDDQLWIANRYNIVVKGNIHKFNQHSEFANFLINTNDRILVEASPTDKIWGIGLSKNAEQIDNPYFWNGQNLLGFALMEARDFLTTFGQFDYDESLISLPWKAHPNVDPHDLFWRMGKGENIVSDFAKYYDKLTEKDKIIFKLNNPEPRMWKGFYQ